MKLWKRNLVVCWFGAFVTAIGMSQIAPVLPLYIKHFGVHSTQAVERYSGLAFGATFIISAIFSPVWGQAADRIGRKPMLLRASLGMSIVIFAMGFAQNIFQFIVLRLLQGVIAGYTTACTTLIATQTERENAGFALGVLSTASISGSLLGPVIGGYVEESFGLSNVFFMTGILMMVAFITTLLFIKEDFKRTDVKTLKAAEIWRQLADGRLVLTLFGTTFVLTLALYTIEPILTVYIDKLAAHTGHIALYAGLAFSASGLASLMAAPVLGRLSDRIGQHKIILVSLLAAGILFIPQAFVTNAYQLMGLRFLLGLTTAGLMPSVNALMKKITPDNLTGRIFGYGISAQYLGVFSGSLAGGQLAATFGIRSVFFVTSILLFLNAVWIYLKIFTKIEKSKLHRNE